MQINELLTSLNSEKWAKTSYTKKIEILKQLYERTDFFLKELSFVHNKKSKYSDEIKEKISSYSSFLLYYECQHLLFPLLGHIEAILELYIELNQNSNLNHAEHKSLRNKNGKLDIPISPHTKLDKVLFPERKDYLRINKENEEIENNAQNSKNTIFHGIICIFGSNDYTSSIEILNALFLENCAVLHNVFYKNKELENIWEDIFSPLIKQQALVFCDKDCLKEIVESNAITKSYFMKGTRVIKEIEEDNNIDLRFDCGGNNPFFIVPSEKIWTKKELEHQALLVLTHAKLNACAIFGRSQSILTSSNWKQKNEFIDEIRKAIKIYSPTLPHYFSSIKSMHKYRKNFQCSKFIRSPQSDKLHKEIQIAKENNLNQESDLFLAKKKKHKFEKLFYTNHFFFNNININEISLDTKAEPKDFLQKAIKYSNEKLEGALSLCIIIDDHSYTLHQEELDIAIENSKYGSIAINTIPPLIFINPYLDWGRNEADYTLVHGSENYGNLFNHTNIEKTISYCSFTSKTAFNTKNKEAFLQFSKSRKRYHVQANNIDYKFFTQLPFII